MIKRNFVSKYIRSIPSTLIWSIDWREIPQGVEVEELEASLISEYSQYAEAFFSRGIKPIFIILLSKSMFGTAVQDELNQSFKKNLDLEQKQIYFSSDFPDFLGASRKKLDIF